MRRFVLGFCTLSVTFAGPLAFQQQPTFRARTDLVQLDVVVVDADGQPVHGLTKDDFQVFDRGRSQTVATVEEFTHERPAPSMFAPTLRRDVADNATSSADRIVILVLDDLHFQGKTGAVKAMARQVVQELGSQASVGLITTSGAFGVEPTEDRALLFREVDRFFDKFDPEGRHVDPKVASGLIMPSIVTSARGDPGDLARFFGDMTQYPEVAGCGEDARRRRQPAQSVHLDFRR